MSFGELKGEQVVPSLDKCTQDATYENPLGRGEKFGKRGREEMI